MKVFEALIQSTFAAKIEEILTHGGTGMEEYLIGMGINVMLSLLKNAAHRETFKQAIGKVYKAIRAAFPNIDADPDFN